MDQNSRPEIKGADQKYCSECGAIINAKAEICPKCGVRQKMAPGTLLATTPNGKNKLIAALLAFFLGGIGIHKFYLGQTGWGIVYLLFCWTLIPYVVSIIEFVLLLLMPDDEFARKYGGAL